MMTQLLSEPKVRTYANSSAVYGPPGGYSPFQVQQGGIPVPMLPMTMVNMGRPNQYMPPTPTMPTVNPAMMGVPVPAMKMTPGAVATPYMVRCVYIYIYCNEACHCTTTLVIDILVTARPIVTSHMLLVTIGRVVNRISITSVAVH